MSSPIDDVLKRFHREYNGASEELERLIRAYIDKGYTPAAAVDRAISETGFNATIAEKVKAAIKDAAIIGAGSEAVIKGTNLYEAWDPSRMNLSQKLHGTSRIMRRSIIEVIRKQLKNSSSATQTARALYDGYGSEADVLRKQAEIPKHLRELIKFSRRMEATPDAVLMLQGKIRHSLRLIERLGDNGAPNKALKASYIDIVKAVTKLNDEVLDRAIKVAVEEKSRYVAERIARTESARAWYQGFIANTIDDPNIVAYRWVMSNRHPTEDICDDHANEDAYGLGAGVFPKDKAPELPAHPHCLCHYEKVYASELKGIGESEKEEQRYGRNKETVINHSYINTGEYRKKFDKITDNDKVNRTLYTVAKEALNHRSGTLYEDMYWIDKTTGEVVGKIVDSTKEQGIIYTESIKRLIRQNKGNLITLHTHPSSMPPSISDFNANATYGYLLSVVCCHDGRVYVYKSNKRISDEIYTLSIAQNKKNGYNEKNAQFAVLTKFEKNKWLSFWEV